jgi:Trypsin-like peptidase domain/PEP-CTERM motif
MMTTPTRLWAAVIASAIALSVAAPVFAGTMRSDAFDFKHRQLAQNIPEARSVGQIVAGNTASNGIIRGSGVLVGGRYVLTAAHLLDDANGGEFTINGQSYGMRRWVVANQFYSDDGDDDRLPDDRLYGNGADLALVELSRPVVGASSLKAKISRSRQEAGKLATIVGFGTGGNGTTGISTPTYSDQTSLDPAGATWQYQPVKRAGRNIIEPQTPFGGPAKSQRELRVDFDPDPSQLPSLLALTPPSFDLFSGEFTLDENDIPVVDEFMPSIGDSGGGLFINGRLAGITSWTTRDNSEFFSTANFTRLSVGWWRWIRDNKRAFNNARKNGDAARPWNAVSNNGNGFKGVLKLRAADQLENDAGDVILFEDQIFNIFGPGLLFDETGARLSVGGDLTGLFVSGDLAARPSPLPEPTSLALLSLGTLAIVRRRRR